VQEGESEIASYAWNQAGGDICDTITDASDGVPVCKVIKFFTAWTNGFWDLLQNTPSSQSGLFTNTFDHIGLGGNINSVGIQLYDPYNAPVITLFEDDYCQGESGAFNTRDFTYEADGTVS
jgi:hypothetical protein